MSFQLWKAGLHLKPQAFSTEMRIILELFMVFVRSLGMPESNFSRGGMSLQGP